MALLLDSLYDALKAAGAPEEQARAAARDVAGYDNRLNRIERDMALLKWMVGFAIAILLGLFWMQWQSLDRLAALDARVANLEAGIAQVEDRLGQVESRLTGVEGRLPGIDGSFETPRSEP
jgi:hypothetical protein